MKLTTLLKAVYPDADMPPGIPDRDVSSIHYRAQDVRPGGLFVAIPGFSADGHDFVDTAFQQGAGAVVVQRKIQPKAFVYKVDDTRKALAALSSRFYQHPSLGLYVIGITGTNGKTTVSYLLEQILTAAGHRVGVIGTINYRFGGENFENPVTTPESLDLQRILARMRDAGVTHVVLEASSHAIDLSRVENCWMDMGIFTNLSQDHLDFHPSMSAYWAVKKRFFTHYLATGPKGKQAMAVVNRAHLEGRELFRELSMDRLSVGFNQGNMVRPERFTLDLTGIAGVLTLCEEKVDFKSFLVGRHNLENIFCAAGAGAALGLAPDVIAEGIRAVGAVPGRLEPVANSAGRFIYVDYAHTPDALEKVLSALGALSRGRIICVFGCGGDRDQEKRPQMGSIAARMSDLAVVTSDNPRTEDPGAIIAMILPGIESQKKAALSPADVLGADNPSGYVTEPDRRKAIDLAIRASREGDTVLIAGKGHETYQILGNQKIAFDDKQVARAALEQSLNSQ